MDNKERYAYSFDPGGDSTPARVVRLVGEGKQVLELGCSSGSMTRVLNEHQHCHVTCLEIDPQAAREAEPWCERMLVGDIDALDLVDTFGDQRFDVVVAADVLEHLVDPWRCLRAVRELLQPEGYVVASVPNVANNGVIAALLEGDFPYQEKGLLDRTHLRFFARRNLEEMFLDTGFNPVQVQRVRVPERHTELNLLWQKLPDSLRMEMHRQADGDTYQFVVKAFSTTESGNIARLRSELQEGTARLSVLEAEHDRVSADLAEHRKAFGEAREIIARLEEQLKKERDAEALAAEQRAGLDVRIVGLERQLAEREAEFARVRSEHESELVRMQAAIEAADKSNKSSWGLVKRVAQKIVRR